jgi:hypothetical protein
LTDHELRAYLLGRLSEAGAQRLEERLIEDEDAFQTLKSLEDDLFDDYARERLDPEERRSFVERYGAQHGRLSFARALRKRAGRPNVVAFRQRPWLPLAAAAGLVLAIGGIVATTGIAPERTPGGLRPGAAPASPATAIVLTLGTSRSAGKAAEATLAKDDAALELRVRLDPADRFDRYALELRSASDEVVWRGDDVKATRTSGELALLATVPARSLAEGSYELAVRGGSNGRPLDDIGFATLGVRRRP